ncbi:MAG: hypothetical protein JWQ71_3416 [Pedosphaera sp.]|nr:hypothetical protein [Pedosphaera sp.]
MKPKYFCSLLLCGIALASIGLRTRQDKGLVIHEWGTFTSVQGSDGVLLAWKPLETSKLPGFVHDWQKPGLNRRSAHWSVFGKGSMVTLQRMETPIIYFYTDKEQTVDLSVGFPQGLITEWFPQVREIGPSIALTSTTVLSMDKALHKVGVSPSFTLASLFDEKPTTNSLVHWSHLEIFPAKDHPKLASLIPSGSSGNHYFAAHDTDSAYVRTPSLSKTNPAPEYEKFLFYRGAGSFATPLITLMTNNLVIVTNTSKEPLKHLFVLTVHNHQGKFVYLDQLAPGEQRNISASQQEVLQPLTAVARQIGNQMESSLIKEGLYQREARAMVNTWNSSWFEEEGVRVLYVLPRNWTDTTLPININPQPRELVRVMVGRAELIPPVAEQQLTEQLVKAGNGDVQARKQVQLTLKTFGRFAEPAFYRALAKATPKVTPKTNIASLASLLSDSQFE